MVEIKVPQRWIVDKNIEEISVWLNEHVTDENWDFVGMFDGVFHFKYEEHAMLFRLKFGL